MSRIQEIKNHNPFLSKSFIDHITLALPNTKPKYVDLLINLLKKHSEETLDKTTKQDWIDELVEFGVEKNELEKLSKLELTVLSLSLTSNINRYNFQSFKKFIEVNEKNLTDNKDITSIKSFDEINDIVSLCELKTLTKELESQVVVVLDNPETGWLLVRPLTFEASKKYGSSTRWCTTEKDSPSYFYRYHNNVLIYCINRKTGSKVAMNHVIEDGDTSFWNAQDTRIDSIFSGLDQECKDVIIKEIKSGLTNKDMTPSHYLVEAELYGDHITINGAALGIIPMQNMVVRLNPNEPSIDEDPETPIAYENDESMWTKTISYLEGLHPELS
jgi:hypothetical protein